MHSYLLLLIKENNSLINKNRDNFQYKKSEFF